MVSETDAQTRKSPGRMASPDLDDKVRGWIRKNAKENSRLEFKLRIALDSSAAKAEFIKDVIALANSEGEYPRAEGHLVIGFKDGQRRDVSIDHYNGATLGQILDSSVYPSISTEYAEFGSKRRVGVLIIRGNANVLHVISKKFLDEKGKPLLLPGQSWGRVSDRKIELDGAAINARHQAILERKIAAATVPLHARIVKLECEAGPALEVKRIRFEIESAQEWSAMADLLAKLHPYAREFDHSVKNEVMDAVLEGYWQDSQRNAGVGRSNSRFAPR